ncbi:MAG: hypothetical protein MZW92_40150 [Comamonadaceae bacterium]|nr:hypothetical protein [Comamonadaceae bacterium]
MFGTRAGVRAAHLRRLERGRLHLGRGQGRHARDRAGAGDRDPVILAAIYLLFVLALLSGLGLRGPEGEQGRRRRRRMARRSAPVGEKLIGAIVALAALTSINATMIVGARTNYALGQRLAGCCRFMSRWHGDARRARRRAASCRARIALALVAFGALSAGRRRGRWSSSPRPCSGASCCWWASRCLRAARDRYARRAGRSACRFIPSLPLVFMRRLRRASFYSSVTYAASRNAVHVSLIVMAAGVVALLFTGAKRSRASGRDD